MEGLKLWIITGLIPWWHLCLFILLLLSRPVRTIYAQGGHATSNPGMRTATTYIRRNLWLATSMNDEDPEGFVLGRWFLAWVSRSRTGYMQVWLIMPRRVALTAEAIEDKRVGNSIKAWFRFGNSKNGMFYFKHEVVRAGEPTAEQQLAMKSILEYARRSATNGFGFTVSVYIHGPPGCGKSQVGTFLARDLGASLCTKHNPFEAGDHMMNMILKVNPTRKNPLVIVSNEWDARARSVFTTPGKYRTKTDCPEVWDKGSYCEYMDDLCSQNNTIFIFTGNSHPDEIDKMDKAVLRDGRIDLKIAMHDVEQVTSKRERRFATLEHKNR